MANHIGKCIDCNTVACVQNSLSSPLEKSEKGREEGLHYKTVAVSVGVIVVCLFVCLFVCLRAESAWASVECQSGAQSHSLFSPSLQAFSLTTRAGVLNLG